MTTEVQRQRIKMSIGSYALLVHSQLHGDAQMVEIGGLHFPIRMMGDMQNLRAVDLPINEKSVRFIVQNPNTGSAYAALANAGHKITWVIVNQENLWIGHVDEPVGGEPTWNQKPDVKF